MKIVQIGGTFVAAQKEIEYGIHQYLQQAGEESYILYSIGESDDPNIIKCESKAESFIRRGLNKIFGKSHRFALLGTLRVLRRLRKIKPDIVHLHTLHHGYYDYEMLFKYLIRKKLPVVFTVHDFWAATGGCYYYTQSGCDQYKTGCRNCCETAEKLDCGPGYTHKNFLRKMKLYEKITDLKVVSVSPWVRDELKRSMLAAYPQYTVWNAVQQPVKLKDTVFLHENDRFRIIGVATAWDERKGISRFIELAKSLGRDFEIILVGNVSQHYRDIAPDNMTFIGEIKEKEELYRLYSEADIHLSLSREETFGMTFIEAAFVGTRSMGFDSTAIPLVLEKTHGIVLKSEKPEDLVTALNERKADKSACKLSRDERRTVAGYFSNDRMAAEYYAVYRDACKCGTGLASDSETHKA